MSLARLAAWMESREWRLRQSIGRLSARAVSCRLRKHALWFPALLISALQHVVVQAEDFSPLRQGAHDSVPFDPNGATPVPCLLFPCRPATVARRVRSVVVDPIKLLPIRPIAHVAQKCLERVAPLDAHCDASASVVREVRLQRIEAPRLSRRPGLIGLGVLRHSRISVPERARHITSTAPATLQLAAQKIVGAIRSSLATVAATEPHGLVLAVASSDCYRAFDHETAKSLTSEISWSRSHEIGNRFYPIRSAS